MGTEGQGHVIEGLPGVRNVQTPPGPFLRYPEDGQAYDLQIRMGGRVGMA